MNHPVLSAIAAMDAALDEVAEVDPMYMTVEEKKAALVGSARVRARADALELRVLAAADDVAETTGDRSTATWLANRTREAHGTVRRKAALARALAVRWTRTADALEAGQVNLAQAREIADALDALPKELGEDLLAKAEALLVAEAAELGPRDLKVFGSRVLEYLAPDIAEEAEYQRLLAAERRAHAATRLSLRPRGDGDGSTDGHFRVPDQVAGRLRTYLNAFTAPRRRHHWATTADQETRRDALRTTKPVEDEFANLPIARQRGEEFVALLENIPTNTLPRHGGTATTLTVTVTYDALVSAIGVATTSTGEPITAGQARRLACQAGMLLSHSPSGP